MVDTLSSMLRSVASNFDLLNNVDQLDIVHAYRMLKKMEKKSARQKQTHREK